MAMQVPGPLLLIVPIFVGVTMVVIGLHQCYVPFNFSLRQHRRIMSHDIHRRRERQRDRHDQANGNASNDHGPPDLHGQPVTNVKLKKT